MKYRKMNGQQLTPNHLANRISAAEANGYGKAKWIEFCETLMADGFACYLYEARQTFSKYVTVSNGRVEVKVRFSNHRPIKDRELAGDCDFFVGITHTGTRTTTDALEFVRRAMRGEMACEKTHDELVDEQAYVLLRERVALFGESWHVGSAIRLPREVAEVVARDGPESLLILLDRERELR